MSPRKPKAEQAAAFGADEKLSPEDRLKRCKALEARIQEQERVCDGLKSDLKAAKEELDKRHALLRDEVRGEKLPEDLPYLEDELGDERD